MTCFEKIGLSKIYKKQDYIKATKEAIENYLKDGNINGGYNIIIIIKIYDNLELEKVNEIFELVQDELNIENISCNIREVKDKLLKDKIEIIIIGV